MKRTGGNGDTSVSALCMTVEDGYSPYVSPLESNPCMFTKASSGSSMPSARSLAGDELMDAFVMLIVPTVVRGGVHCSDFAPQKHVSQGEQAAVLLGASGPP